jgi:Ca2+-binding RTX toxin-like protein
LNASTANVTGALSVTGGATITSGANVDTLNASTANVTGALSVTGGATITSGANVDTLNASTANVSGVLTVSGGATITGGLNVDSITASGEIDAQAFATTSDRRLKKDVEEVADALAKVKALRPVEYNWISSANLNPSCKELGFLAQEVEEIVPAVVATSDDENATKRVAYDRLTALLVGAVKEQSAIIDALKARIEALESKCA